MTRSLSPDPFDGLDPFGNTSWIYSIENNIHGCLAKSFGLFAEKTFLTLVILVFYFFGGDAKSLGELQNQTLSGMGLDPKCVSLVDIPKTKIALCWEGFCQLLQKLMANPYNLKAKKP